MVPKKSQFSPKGPNFALVKLFRGRSQIPNPVLERLLLNFGCISSLAKMPAGVYSSSWPCMDLYFPPVLFKACEFITVVDDPRSCAQNRHHCQRIRSEMVWQGLYFLHRLHHCSTWSFINQPLLSMCSVHI